VEHDSMARELQSAHIRATNALMGRNMGIITDVQCASELTMLAGLHQDVLRKELPEGKGKQELRDVRILLLGFLA